MATTTLDTSTTIFLAACGFLTYAVMTSGVAPMTDYGPDYLFPAVPAFLLLMLVEAVLIAKYCPHENAQYTFTNFTISSITASVQQAMITLIMKPTGAPMFFYLLTYQRINTGLNLPFPLAILGMDFCFYWMHRECHTRAFLWAAHSAHHAPPTFNLTTGIRISWYQTLFQWIFYLPGALFISPPVMWLCLQFHDVYTFATHTYAIKRLPWLCEQVLVTPSHHRVHHDRRLHKNFGGIFILWDRLFGTFHDNGPRDDHFFGVADNKYSRPLFQILQITQYLAFFDKLCSAASLEAVIQALRGPGWATLFVPRQLVAPHHPQTWPHVLPFSSKLVIGFLTVMSIAMLVLIPNSLTWTLRLAWFGTMLLMAAAASIFYPREARL
jgi:sterol desaturase/sphingolipid hydroxylase (fatty acid hydroxylase superfamily)